jgi:ketosteroid isomerase-like protein
MSELDDFRDETIPRQVEAEEAIHNGDPAPRLAMWSTHDPVTLFGAATSKSGADEVRRFFKQLASQFSDCTAYDFELVAAGASGDLAYTVGYEHTSVSIDGHPVAPYTLRVTHVYRREDGEWRIVHRHGGPPPVDPPLAGAVRR